MRTRLQDISIRTTYQPGDLGYITYMHGLLYDFGPHFEVYVAETLADFYRNIDEKQCMWVAEHEGKMIGTIALKNTKEEAQLRYFLIDPDYRGIGLGTCLMDLFLAFMQEKGYTSSFLLTEEKLKTATHLYEKNGYKYVSSSTTDFGLVEKRYELKLGN